MYHTVVTVPISNGNIVDSGKFDTTQHKYDRSLSWLGTGTSTKGVGFKLVYANTPLLLLKWCRHANTFHTWVQCHPSQITSKPALLLTKRKLKFWTLCITYTCCICNLKYNLYHPMHIYLPITYQWTIHRDNCFQLFFIFISNCRIWLALNSIRNVTFIHSVQRRELKFIL